MTRLLWLAAVMMLLSAAMLVAGLGAPAPWIAIATIGIAVVVIEKRRHSAHA